MNFEKIKKLKNLEFYRYFGVKKFQNKTKKFKKY